MKSILTAATVATGLFLAAVPTAGMAQNMENAPIMSWGQFSDQLDARNIGSFTGVSNGFVAFTLCDGRWFRVRGTVANVQNALRQRGYARAECVGGGTTDR